MSIHPDHQAGCESPREQSGCRPSHVDAEPRQAKPFSRSQCYNRQWCGNAGDDRTSLVVERRHNLASRCPASCYVLPTAPSEDAAVPPVRRLSCKLCALI